LEFVPPISGDLKLSKRAARSIGCADDEFKGLPSDAGADHDHSLGRSMSEEGRDAAARLIWRLTWTLRSGLKGRARAPRAVVGAAPPPRRTVTTHR
jgi:hypothetical protein